MDKKRLEDIKEKYSEVTVLEYINDIEIVGVDMKDLVWLIQQAERVEKLQLEVNDWRDEVIKWHKRFEESEESHLETKELLRSTISEIKRYKQTLELIYKDTFYESEHDLVSPIHVIRKRAEKALEGKE